MKLHRTYNIDTQTMLQDEHGANIGLVEVSVVDELIEACNNYEAKNKRLIELEKALSSTLRRCKMIEIPQNYELFHGNAEQLLKEVES